MQNEKITLPLDIYFEQLTQINGVEFTTREVDVISCLLNRRATSISGFLLVGPRAVETYIRNIRQKAGGLAGREQIIDFIERSDKFSLIKNEYYFSLRSRVLFEEKLNAIAKKVDIKSSTCLLVYEKGQKYKPSLIPYLKEHLKRIGFEVRACSSEEDGFFTHPNEILNLEQINHVLYISPNNLSDTQIAQINTSHLSNVIFLFEQNTASEETYKKLKTSNYINMLEKENYYLSFFEILKKLLPHSNFENLVEEFKQQSELINESFESTIPQEDLKVQEEPPCPPTNKNFLNGRKWYSLIGFITVISALSIGFFIFREKPKNEVGVIPSLPQQSDFPTRSDLILPNENMFLKRPELIGQIDNKFKEQSGIQSIALVGVGGAGKTTLARQYAHQQKESIIWEINAETQESLKSSFEHLAQALSKTVEDQKVLRGLQGIKDPMEKEEKIIQFVKEKLRASPSWFLIFDNVVKFSDVHKYFPQDFKTWGRGKIILTTQDNNIQNNKHFNFVLYIGELNSSQKLHLYMKIISNTDSRTIFSTDVEQQVFLMKDI